MVGSWIEFLKRNGPQQVFYEDMLEINKPCQKYKPKEDETTFVTQLLETIHNPDLENILKQDICMPFDGEKIKQIFEDSFQMEKMLLVLWGKNLKFEANRKEEHFNLEYRIDPMSENQKKWFQSHEFVHLFKLPTKNRFIPHNFDLVEVSLDQEIVYPDNPKEHLFTYHRCSSFKEEPKCKLDFTVWMDTAHLEGLKRIRNKIFRGIFVKLLEQFFVMEIEEAGLVSLSCSIWNADFGLGLSLKGFNDSMQKFAEALLLKLNTSTAAFWKDKKDFENQLTVEKQKWENNLKADASDFAENLVYEANYVRHIDFWEYKEESCKMYKAKDETFEEF